MTIVENPRYMMRSEIHDTFKEKYVAVVQPDETKVFEGGTVVAFDERNCSDASWGKLYDYIHDNYGGHSGHVDLIKDEEDDDLYVIFRDVR